MTQKKKPTKPDVDPVETQDPALATMRGDMPVAASVDDEVAPVAPAPGRIREAISHVESVVHNDSDWFVPDLITRFSLDFGEVDGWFCVQMLGIEAQSSVSYREALKVWCRAARRSLL